MTEFTSVEEDLKIKKEEIKYGPNSKIYREFVQYHSRHPEVYWQLRDLSLEWKKAGHSKIGMKMLFEVVRWNAGIRPDRDQHEEFVLNNNYTSHYARLLMENEQELKDIFEIRSLRSM
jgi:hypothetical protein